MSEKKIINTDTGVKIMTTAFHRRGKIIDFNGLLVQFDDSGVATVEQSNANFLLDHYKDSIQTFDEEKIKNIDDLEGEELKAFLVSLSVLQLQEIAEARAYNANEWRHFTGSNRFASYLIKKFEEDDALKISQKVSQAKEVISEEVKKTRKVKAE